MCGISEQLGERRLKTKFREVEKANLAYVKQRKHRKNQTRHIIMHTLKLLGKILAEIRRQVRIHPDMELAGKRDAAMIDVITKVYRQQKNHYGLRKVNAILKETEILAIFLGIHTANVVQQAERLQRQQKTAAA